MSITRVCRSPSWPAAGWWSSPASCRQVAGWVSSIADAAAARTCATASCSSSRWGVDGQVQPDPEESDFPGGQSVGEGLGVVGGDFRGGVDQPAMVDVQPPGRFQARPAAPESRRRRLPETADRCGSPSSPGLGLSAASTGSSQARPTLAG